MKILILLLVLLVACVPIGEGDTAPELDEVEQLIEEPPIDEGLISCGVSDDGVSCCSGGCCIRCAHGVCISVGC